MRKEIGDWDDLVKRAKMRLLRMHYESNACHLGSNLSCLDILLYLHHYQMNPEDVFILSKGHAAGAMYVTLWTMGLLTDDDLTTFHKDNTKLPGHITSELGTFMTGSLGHGLSLAVGMATADKLVGRKRKIYCLVGDGECQEGSVREVTGAPLDLSNLSVMTDCNGWQGLGKTSKHVNCLYDGHNFFSIKHAFEEQQHISFRTIKGHGTPLADTLGSHYLTLTKEQHEASLRQLVN